LPVADTNVTPASRALPDIHDIFLISSATCLEQAQ
jgi:hypothetical protein